MFSINYSIVIPHKDIPELLVRCLDSIPQRGDIQVIIADDCSDNAESFLKEYTELSRPEVEVIFTKEGKGAGYARNIGLERVKGKWVLFADADDFFLPGWIDITDQYLDSNADVIQFRIDDILCHSDCNWHNGVLDRYAAGKQSDKDVLFSNITCWAKMFRSSFIKENNIVFEEVKCANDVAFGYQVAVKADSIAISPYAIYNVTYRKGSLTTINNIEFSWLRYNVEKKAKTYAAEHGFQQYELPHVMEVLRTWRQLGLREYIRFIWHERHEIVRASKVRVKDKPFNYRHPYLYVLLVLLKLV